MGLKDLWNDIEDGLSDAKDWVEDNVDDVDDWIEDKLEDTPFDGTWDKLRDVAENRAWGYVEETLGDGRADLVADVYHGRTDEAVATLGGYAEAAVEDTWAEDYVEGAGKVVDAIQDGPEALAKLGADYVGEQAEGSWAEGLWGAVGKPATGIAAGLAAKAGDELEGGVLEEGFEAVAHVADLAGGPAEDATVDAAGEQPAETPTGDATASAPSPLAEAIEGRGIVNEMILRPAVEPQDGGFVTLDGPAPLGEAIPEIATAPAPTEATTIPEIAPAPTEATTIPEIATAPAPTEATTIPEIPTAPASSEAVPEAPAAEAAPAVETTAFEATVAAADVAETSIDDMFTDLA